MSYADNPGGTNNTTPKVFGNVSTSIWEWDNNNNQKKISSIGYLGIPHGSVTVQNVTDLTITDADQVDSRTFSGRSNGVDVSGITTTFAHNPAGGRSTPGVSATTYDYKDQLIGYQFLAGTAVGTRIDYLYDHSNRLKERRINGNTSELFYWDGGQIVKEYKYDTTTIPTPPPAKTWYLIGQDREAVYKNGNWHVLFTDEQGSQVGSTDPSGNFANARNFGVGGGVLNTNPTQSIQNDFLWHGMRVDSLTGLYYAHNRWTDGTTFMSRDPIRYGGGLNMNAYGGGDFVNNPDPSGLDYWDGVAGECLRFAESTRPLPLKSLFDGPQWHDPVGDLDARAGLFVVNVALLLRGGMQFVRRLPVRPGMWSGADVVATEGATEVSGELIDAMSSRRKIVFREGAEPMATGPNWTTIVLPPDAKKLHLIHEFLHGTQMKFRMGGKLPYGMPEFFWSDAEVLQLETQIHRFIERHYKMLGLSERDVELSAKYLETYR